MAKASNLQERRIEWVPLGEVQSAPTNPKEHDIGEICMSIGRRGFVELPAIDERTGRLVAGHGRIEALIKMQADKAPLPGGLKADGGKWLVPVVRGWASKNDADAAAYLVASNRLVELGGWNEAELADLLASVAADGDLIGTGYDGESLDELLKSIGVGAETEMPDLATGERETFSSMTFILSAVQVELIKTACKRIGSAPDGSGNKNSSGNALANLARAFLAKVDS